MRLSDIFLGAYGHIYASTIILVILFILVRMSLQLYARRRKKGYFTLFLSLLLAVVQYSAGIIAHLQDEDASVYLHSGLYDLLAILSFLTINMGVYQLYNSSRRKDFAFFSILFITPILWWGFHAARGYGLFGMARKNAQLALTAGLDLYMVLLLFLSFWLITPVIGQYRKYQIGLTALFFAHMAHIVTIYLYEQPATLFVTAETYLPILFFGMLFSLLFDRVVELMQAIYHSSITDGLTGLYNRKFFFNRVNQYTRRNLKIAVIFTDIDNFKRLNDTQGHEKGDQALKKVAQIIREVCEEWGISGRYGGEELVALLTDPQAKPEEVAETIRSRVEAEAGVTISVGYSKGKKGIGADELIKQADLAMYASKTTGKNKVTGYTKDLSMLKA